jgi:hypothetical protein
VLLFGNATLLFHDVLSLDLLSLLLYLTLLFGNASLLLLHVKPLLFHLELPVLLLQLELLLRIHQTRLMVIRTTCLH